jgi:hypothetical protein
MSVWSRIRQSLPTRRPDDDAEGSESDVPVDPALASSRATGGEDADLDGDRGSVTGTGDTGVFVGRVAGDDLGYAGETGAERRAEAGDSTSHETGTRHEAGGHED